MCWRLGRRILWALWWWIGFVAEYKQKKMGFFSYVFIHLWFWFHITHKISPSTYFCILSHICWVNIVSHIMHSILCTSSAYHWYYINEENLCWALTSSISGFFCQKTWHYITSHPVSRYRLLRNNKPTMKKKKWSLFTDRHVYPFPAH